MKKADKLTILNKVADKWDRKTKKEHFIRRTRWHKSSLILKHINKLVSGSEYPGFSKGIIHVVKDKINGKPFSKGISVGCGSGAKEMELIRESIVQEFELFELSNERILHGKELAKKLGLTKKVVFRNEDAFKVDIPDKSYDLVHCTTCLMWTLQ